MRVLLLVFTLWFTFCKYALARDETVLKTEVFEIVVDPAMFNWTYEGVKDQFVYQASLLNGPDLPSWINYVYSERHHCGFLYGVPPEKLENTRVPLEIVALNTQNYETRVEHVNIVITEKLNRAKYQVHMKINNLNVDDMFDVNKMENLKDVFRKQLWMDSEDDIYPTFLSSAIKLGARKPLNPNEGEGVVLRLGSEMQFSKQLTELQEEVRPLWKMPQCPRDYKRTSVERFFRDAGFILDWCSFRLYEDNNSVSHPSITNEKLLNARENPDEGRWQSYSKLDLPIRQYGEELMVAILVPVLIMIALASILSFILCFEHEDFERMEEEFDSTHYNSNAKTMNHVNHDLNLTPDPLLLSRSHTDSPTSTIGRGMHCRPSPPPYIRPKYKPDL